MENVLNSFINVLELFACMTSQKYLEFHVSRNLAKIHMKGNDYTK